ncbi:MAG: glycosyltransferase family 4 protein [Pseudomonadota bacterium]
MSESVLVVHAGARHNYAIPAAFARAGMLEAFYTDMCANRGLGRLNLSSVPGEIGRLSGRLADRKPPSEVLERTRTADWQTLVYELRVRQIRDPSLRRRALTAASQRRGEIMARWGLGEATHLFAALGEGGALCRLARDTGLPILTDVVIALSTARIHMAEAKAFPDWGPFPANIDGAALAGHSLETTDVFVCPSRFVADDLVEAWGVDRAATRIVPYTVPDHWFERMPQPKKGRVLFVGSADRRKGIHYLAMAAQHLSGRRSDLEFRIAGEVHDEVRNRPEARALNFLGRIPRTNVPREFQLADIFVLPSLAEGSATVIYEAMAAGLPVVTTRSAGSVIQHGKDGIIVPERHPEALADAVEHLVEDRDTRDWLAKAARARAQEFRWARYQDSMVNLVRSTPSG